LLVALFWILCAGGRSAPLHSSFTIVIRHRHLVIVIRPSSTVRGPRRNTYIPSGRGEGSLISHSQLLQPTCSSSEFIGHRPARKPTTISAPQHDVDLRFYPYPSSRLHLLVLMSSPWTSFVQQSLGSIEPPPYCPFCFPTEPTRK
jgi:hypothetical protein